MNNNIGMKLYVDHITKINDLLKKNLLNSSLEQLNELLYKINKDMDNKNIIFRIKNETNEFKKLQYDFKKITGKFFDISINVSCLPHDYNIYILDNNNRQICSKGEEELIYFLGQY